MAGKSEAGSRKRRSVRAKIGLPKTRPERLYELFRTARQLRATLDHVIKDLDEVLWYEEPPVPVESGDCFGAIGADERRSRPSAPEERDQRLLSWCRAKANYEKLMEEGRRTGRYKRVTAYPGPDFGHWGIEKALECYYDYLMNGDDWCRAIAVMFPMGTSVDFDQLSMQPFAFTLSSQLAATSARAAIERKGAVARVERIRQLESIVNAAARFRGDGWPTATGSDVQAVAHELDGLLMGARSLLIQSGRAYSVLARDSIASTKPDTREPPREGPLRSMLEYYLEKPERTSWVHGDYWAAGPCGRSSPEPSRRSVRGLAEP